MEINCKRPCRQQTSSRPAPLRWAGPPLDRPLFSDSQMLKRPISFVVVSTGRRSLAPAAKKMTDRTQLMIATSGLDFQSFAADCKVCPMAIALFFFLPPTRGMKTTLARDRTPFWRRRPRPSSCGADRSQQRVAQGKATRRLPAFSIIKHNSSSGSSSTSNQLAFVPSVISGGGH
jgi:hypothetical protein